MDCLPLCGCALDCSICTTPNDCPATHRCTHRQSVRVGDALLDGLAAHCESRAVDQGALDIVQHRALATHALSDAITDTAVGSGPAAGNVPERNASST